MNTTNKFTLSKQVGTAAKLAALCIVCVLLFAVSGCSKDIRSESTSDESIIEDESDESISIGETLLEEPKDAIDEYIFPIQPGTDEWYALEMEERWNAIQLPDEVLSNISTACLLELCLVHPFLMEIGYSCNQQSFDRFVSRSNAFRELLKRRALPDVLIQKSLKFSEVLRNLPSLTSLSLLDQGRFSFNNYYLGVLVAQDVVIDNLNAELEEILLLLSLERYTIMSSNPDLFGNWPYIPVFVLCVKILLKNDLANSNDKSELISFIQNPAPLDPNLINYYLEKYFSGFY